MFACVTKHNLSQGGWRELMPDSNHGVRRLKSPHGINGPALTTKELKKNSHAETFKKYPPTATPNSLNPFVTGAAIWTTDKITMMHGSVGRRGIGEVSPPPPPPPQARARRGAPRGARQCGVTTREGRRRLRRGSFHCGHRDLGSRRASTVGRPGMQRLGLRQK